MRQPDPTQAAAPGCRPLLVLRGRSRLAFADLHGEPLYAHPMRALAAAAGPFRVVVDPADEQRVRADVGRWQLSADVVAGDDWWPPARRAAAPLLLHDGLCPLVPAAFLASMLSRGAEQPGVAHVAVRPVTDTLKEVVGDRILGTIDRARLVSVTAPVLVPPAMLAPLAEDAPPPVDDFGRLVTWLRARGTVELVRAPSLGRRVEHARAVHLLECVEEVGHRVRAEAGHPASAAEHRP